MNVKRLNQEFSIKGHVEFQSGLGGFAVAKIHNKLGSAVISMYGAHVQSFIPASQKELLWMSPDSVFEKGKPIRGGIPVCFPWFGPHAADSSKPLHGFARINDWKVHKTDVLADGSTLLILTFESNRHTLQIWPNKFEAQINLIVGKTLELTLTYKNTGTEAFVCSDALHSYFNISDITKIGIDFDVWRPEYRIDRNLDNAVNFALTSAKQITAYGFINLLALIIAPVLKLFNCDWFENKVNL